MRGSICRPGRAAKTLWELTRLFQVVRRFEGRLYCNQIWSTILAHRGYRVINYTTEVNAYKSDSSKP